MDYSARIEDSTAGGISVKGKGEGGFHMRSRASLFTLEPEKTGLGSHLVSALNVSTIIHWSIIDPQFKYRRITGSVQTKSDNISHRIVFYATTTDSSEFLTLKNQVGYKSGRWNVNLKYTHRDVHYRGTYSKTLELHTGYDIPNTYSVTVKCFTRDVMLPDKFIDILILQKWTLSKWLNLDWSIKLPWHERELSDDMYYQARIRTKF
jgi:hypothetical protein